ncbi:hypothetical protein EUGRSUZ_I00113 [Eucalyptus grandis]|uniref:Uncharacterized protein n=2 Tax=Eucalyptus grandis TaxID=71139 RepID=A0ACC3JBC0_EUCGR|nr:hypothetical protein EUGRSUZ_I00113 [Eucalyptus grandis]
MTFCCIVIQVIFKQSCKFWFLFFSNTKLLVPFAQFPNSAKGKGEFLLSNPADKFQKETQHLYLNIERTTGLQRNLASVNSINLSPHNSGKKRKKRSFF